MANKIVTVLEADGVTQTDVDVLGLGRQAIAASKSVALSAEDFAVLDQLEALLTTVNSSIVAATIPTVAHDAVDSGNPLKIGARARSSEIAAVANNDRTDLLTDLVGKLITLPYANPENFVKGATAAITSTTATQLLPAPSAGLRNYITQITVSNKHATAGTDVEIRDGSTLMYTVPAAALYGGAVLTFPTPLRQPTTATVVNCAALIAADIKVSASGYIGV